MHIEYAENGSLFGFLQRSQVNIGQDLKWAMEIAQGELDLGVQYCSQYIL